MARKAKKLFKINKGTFRLFLAFLAALSLYLLYLDRKIQSKFEAHRWNLPSRVYAEPFVLYPGQALSPGEAEEKLTRLGYKRVSSGVRNIGEFDGKGPLVSVYLHDFAYPEGEQKGFLAHLEFEEGRLRRIYRPEEGEELQTLKFEPELVASIFDEKMEDRTLVTLDELPPALLNATVLIEDERFYSHIGVDPISIGRALVTDIIHLKLKQGGSTLTQQLVKNFFLTSKKSFVRKFNEMLMAMLLELHYTKEEILEAYFNEIYFGQRGAVSVTGVEEAAKLYFSKKASQLTVAESALLAGMIRSPGAYSPFRNVKAAYERRNFVLKRLSDKGKITKAQYREAVAERLHVPERNTRVFQAPFFVDFVQRQLKEEYPADILEAQGLSIFTTLDMDAQKAAEDAVRERLDELEKSRPKLKEGGRELEGMLVAVQPQTGAIRAFVGGRSYGKSQFNRVIDAFRQPGSAFKPFVYLAALSPSVSDEPFTAASLLKDEPLKLKSGGQDWRPKNYDNKAHGLVPLREALENSYNLATVWLALQVGLDEIVELAQKAGIESELQPYPSLALGAFEVKPLELLRAYTIFPNKGMRSELLAIKSVVTREGEVLEKQGFKMKKVAPPDAIYLTNHVLKGVLDRGTAEGARRMGFTGLAAGKTGTTSDYRDSWFVGYTPDLLALSWVGYDDAAPTGLSGSSGALPIWTQFMKTVNPRGASLEDFAGPDNILLVKVDRSGKLYREKCGDAFIEEAFIRGTEPEDYCD